jgi:hypothetical protein
MWQCDPRYTAMVMAAWNAPGETRSLNQLMAHLGTLKCSVHTWEVDTFGSDRNKFREVQKELEQTWGQSIASGPTMRERRIMAQMSEIYLGKWLWKSNTLRWNGSRRGVVIPRSTRQKR